MERICPLSLDFAVWVFEIIPAGYRASKSPFKAVFGRSVECFPQLDRLLRAAPIIPTDETAKSRLSRNKANHRFRDRRRETLFVDARKLGRMIDRTHRELTDEEVARIANTYHAWRGEPDAGTYEDVSGFARSATTDEIAAHGYVLTPGRFVGAADVEDDDEPFEEKMRRLVATLEEQFAEGAKLEGRIRENLQRWGFGRQTDHV